jgi:DeoR/GlpR family transcriptional regulator of sugar metabolism
MVLRRLELLGHLMQGPLTVEESAKKMDVKDYTARADLKDLHQKEYLEKTLEGDPVELKRGAKVIYTINDSGEYFFISQMNFLNGFLPA